jgi:inosine-uridine nucleoside N-ribohydrolase
VVTDPSRSVPVLLDTDIGSDIDDAVALVYLLSHPDCELVGITTVTGDTEARAACATALCDAARADVPVHAGLSGPLLDGPGQPNVPQYAAIAASAPAEPPGHRDAIDFMRETIRARPGEIELLTIGPLTNVAVLFALDPEVPSLLRGMTSMAGWYFADRPSVVEWNIVVDPLAAAIAFRDAPDPHTCVGIDVTLGLRLGRGDVEDRFSRTPLLRVVLEMAQVFFRETDHITFHDPLAAAVLFEPTLCTFEAGDVMINVPAGATGSCFTHFTSNAAGRARAAATVDADAFFAEYFARTTPS